jgi:hypothetical protein
MKGFTVGDQVEDLWWSNVCGSVMKVTRNRVFVKVRHPSLVPYSFGMEDGIVHYDMPHARKYLIKTTAKK